MLLSQKSWGALILGVLLAAPSLMFGQSGAGSIQGTVEDASGAALPGATIHVVNEGTGVVNDATANSAGVYAVQGLFAGKYTITYSSKGMKKYQTVVDLQDAQNLVLNPKLSVGDVSEQVTVAAEDVQLVTRIAERLAPSWTIRGSINCRRMAAASSAWPRTRCPAWKQMEPASMA